MLSTFFDLTLGVRGSNSSGTTTHVLNTAYNFGTAANQAFAIRFISPVTSMLTHAYFFVSASNGAVGNVTCEVRNYSSLTVPAGGAALATQSASWVGATKWLQVAFGSPASVTQGSVYYVVIGNADGSPGTNYPTIRTAYNGPTTADGQRDRFMGITSSDGFTTGAAVGSPRGSLGVLKFADGTVIGNPYTTTGNYTSNGRRRGLKIDQLPKSCGFDAVLFGAMSSMSALEVYSGTTIPGGSLVRTADPLTAAQIALLLTQVPELVLSANTVYRLVTTFSGNSAHPGYWQIEDHASFPDVLLAGIAGGKLHSTISDGGTPEAWVDEVDKLPKMSLCLTQYGESAGGGSGDYTFDQVKQLRYKSRAGVVI